MPSSSQPELTENQSGFGLDCDFISKITSLIDSRLAKQQEANARPTVVPTYKFYQPTTPVTVTSVGHDNTVPPVPFDCQIFQNDLNDTFDHKNLLKKVPKNFQEQAKNLLKALDERSNELTWDSSGKANLNVLY